MYETVVTVVGNVVDSPRLRRTGTGVDVANFRIASTSRRYDRGRDSWVDCGTVFLGVVCWRQLGVNVATSLHRGHPVVVTGRLLTRTYEVNGQQRSALEVEASAVGHDLTRGTATFKRRGHAEPPDVGHGPHALAATEAGSVRDGAGGGSGGGGDGTASDPDATERDGGDMGATVTAPDDAGGALDSAA